MSPAARAPMVAKDPQSLGISSAEFILAGSSILGAYLGGLWFLHLAYRRMYGSSNVHHDFTQTYVWDHPEPNFTVSAAITEFWSVVSAIPLAGGLLCFQGFRCRLGKPVVAVFVGTFLMYNFAFFSHMTLWKPIFQLTLTSVMTNCFSAFFLYGFLAEDLAYAVPVLHRFACEQCRMKVAVPSIALVAIAAVNLPDAIGKSGGVWTLFYVQAPPVWIASLAALSLMFFSRREELQPAYHMVTAAGFFLSTAMLLSYFECRTGTASVLEAAGGFPSLHVAIHVSEQIGIYLYGVSLAYLQHAHVSPRPGSEFKWVCGGTVPYFWCDVIDATSQAPHSKDVPTTKSSSADLAGVKH